MKILDPGHIYEFAVLDGDATETLRFVKRNIPAGMYPGNKSAHCGTTTQEVIRALLDRSRYVQGQFWCAENILVGICLRFAFWLLELRAARRHWLLPHWNPWTAVKVSPCPCCLHIRCAKARARAHG